MFLWPFVLFNSEASFSKQDFESMDSTLLFLATRDVAKSSPLGGCRIVFT